MSKTVNGERLFSDVSFTVEKGDKIAFLARDPRAVSALFDILVGDDKADSGVVEWGTTINYAYLPLNNAPGSRASSRSSTGWRSSRPTPRSSI